MTFTSIFEQEIWINNHFDGNNDIHPSFKAIKENNPVEELNDFDFKL